VANFEYSVCVFRFKENERALKFAFLINMIMYGVFNAIIMNFVGTLSCIVVAVTTAIFLVKDKKRKADKAPADSSN